MPRVHELPTHLQVEDVLLAGLTARQLLRLMIGASLAYGLWDQALCLPVVAVFSFFLFKLHVFKDKHPSVRANVMPR